MAQNKIDSASIQFANTAKFFFYVKGSKDYPTDQVVSDKFGYENSVVTGEYAQTAVFNTSIKDIMIRTTNPKQIDNLYSLNSDIANNIPTRSLRSGLNIRNDRSQEFISSMILDNGKVLSNSLQDPTRFVDHIDPNYSVRSTGEEYTLENVKKFKQNGGDDLNIYPLEHIFWQKIFTICEFIKKYETEIIDMYVDNSKKYPSFFTQLSDETLNSFYGSEYVPFVKTDLENETEIGRFISLFIGKCTDTTKHFETKYEQGSAIGLPPDIKYNPYRWKELTGQDNLVHNSNNPLTVDEEQEMFWNTDVLNMKYVVGSANFEPSSHENRIKKFSFQVSAQYTSDITKNWVIICYLDPDAFVSSSSVPQYAVYTYNDEDMDGATGAADENYGIYDNDYANVASDSPTLRNNFVTSQSEFQKRVIQGITDIMKDGTYKYYEEFQTLRVTPVINPNDRKNILWDQVNHSIIQKFYIFYGSEASAPTLAQQIAAVKDYIKRLHTSGHCHPTKYDDDGNIQYIGHTSDELDQFLSNMYPNLFTITEVYITPMDVKILASGETYDPENYFATANIEDTYNRIRNLGGIFRSFEYSPNGRANLVTAGDTQTNIPIEFIHVGSIANGEETNAKLKYPMPLICTSFGTTEARPLTNLSGFANYKTKLFTYDKDDVGAFNFADKLQIVLIKLMEAMFTESANSAYYSTIAGIPITYEVDRNADDGIDLNGYKKNVAKFVINNVNFIVISHKGKYFAKNVNSVEV